MAFEIQSKLREQKAMGGLPSNWKVEFVEMHEHDGHMHSHFVHVDFVGEHHDQASAQALADKLLKALNDE
jgi:hypothetical protein